jgi:hypothetical protein
MISLKLDLSKIQAHENVHNIEGNKPKHVLMRTQKRYLQTIDEVAIASPSHPHPSLAQISQDHKFDTPISFHYLPYEIISLLSLNSSIPSSSMESPHYIGFGGLTTMERISHHIH